MLEQLRRMSALLALPVLGALLGLAQSSQAEAQARPLGTLTAGPGRSHGFSQTTGKPQRVLPKNFNFEEIEKQVEGNPRMPILKEGPFAPYKARVKAETAPRASSDPVAFATAKLPANLAGVSTGDRSTVHEPSVAQSGNTIFYTANWYAAKSTNGGTSWSYVNPYTLFPSDSAGSFCCDQLVESFNYNGQEYFVWVLQYLKKNTGQNYYRVAWATPAQVATNSWSNSLIFSGDISGAGNWADYPDLAVSNNNVYLSCNIFNNSDQYQHAVVIRIPMSDLVNGGGFSYLSSQTANASLRFAQGCTDVQFFASHNNTSSMKLFRWAENSNSITNANVTVAAWNSSNYSTTTPDGHNWLARADDRITAGAKAGNELWFGWTAGRGTQGGQTRQHPYVAILRASASDLTRIADGNLSNASYAIAYPAFAPNQDGEVGITCVAGGGSFFPTPQFGFVTGNTALATPNGFAGTHGPVEAEWGDYLTIHPLRTNPKLLIASNFALQGGGGGSFSQSQYVVFGRSSDVNGGGTATISVNTPNGGESWATNSQQTVNWSSSNVTGNVNLEISVNGTGGPWSTLVADTANDGTQLVTTPATATTQARVRVTSVANAAVFDISDANFTLAVVPTGDSFEPDNTAGEAKQILSGQVQTHSIHVGGDVDWATFTIPNGGGSVVAQTGGSNPTIDDTVLQLFSSNGTTILDENDDITSGTNLYSRVQANSLAAGTYYLKVRAFGAAGTIPSYTLSLTITPAVTGSLTVTSPNGGETWEYDGVEQVTWTSQGVASNIKIELSTNNGTSWTEIAGSVPNTGSANVNVPTVSSTSALIKISSVSEPAVSDTSNAVFSISIPPDQYEVDDSRAAAKALLNNQPQDRNIHTVGNQDYAKITLTATRVVTVTTAGPEGDTVIELLNKSGSRLAFNDDISQSNRFSRVSKKLTKGTYYVRVYEYSNGGFGNATIPAYTLTMAQRKP